MDTHQVAARCVYEPGDSFEGMYQVRKSLGEGSFGAVYQVSDGRMDYALKLLRLWDVTPDIRQDLCDRFRQEYETGRIECQQIVQAYTYGKVKGNPYILMEFCPGGDLTPYLGQAGPRAATICRDILLGLKALHKHETVHRDLKPENVLFKHDGTAALTDFGIVGNRLHRMTQVGILTRKPKQIFGTYAYMPPEQANLVGGGATVRNTTDIFSFGVLAYQLLTNQLPFGRLETHNDVPEYLKRGKNGQWNSSILRNLENGQQWACLIEGCIRADYHARLQSVDDVLRLLPLQDQSGIPTHPMDRRQQSMAYRYQPVSNEPGSFAPGIPTMGSPRLRIIGGSAVGHVYELEALLRLRGNLLEVGRHHDCAVYIPSPEGYVSRHQCTLQPANNGRQWLLNDGQWLPSEQRWAPSRNGTFVNSQMVGPQGFHLSPGDTVSMGDVTLIFEIS